MKTLIALVALLLAPQDPDPLQPFTDLSGKLNEGAAAWLDGKAAAEAWPWWTTNETAEAKVAREKGVAKIAVFGFEFEIYLIKDGKEVFCHEFSIILLDGKPTIGEARERVCDEDLSGAPAGDIKDKTGLLAKGAEALVGLLRKNDPAKIPVSDMEQVRKVIASKTVQKNAEKEIAKLKEALPKLLATIAKIEYDAIRVSIDDQIFIAYDKDGKPIGGIRADFDLDAKGNLRYDVGRFLDFPK